MSKGQKVKRIGIFGHVGNKNLGDESIIASVIQNIRRAMPILSYTLYSQS